MKLSPLIIIVLLLTCTVQGAVSDTSFSEIVDSDQLQNTNWSCGPAALRRLLSHYNIRVSEEELISKALATPEKGTSLLNLKKAADSYGLISKGQKWNLKRLKLADAPVIAHFGGNHFVVVDAVKNDQVFFFDPTRGDKTLGIEEFLSRWKGVVLYIENDEKTYPVSVLPPSDGGLPSLSLERVIQSTLQNSNQIRLSEQILIINKSQLELTQSQYTAKEAMMLDISRSGEINTNSPDSYGRQQQLQYNWQNKTLSPEKLGGTLTTNIGFSLSVQESENNGFESSSYSAGPTLSLSYEQPLSKSGRIGNHAPLSIAQRRWEESLLQHQHDREQIIYEAIVSFYNLAKTKQLITLTEENTKQTLKQLEHATTQYRLGNIAEIEISKMEVQLSRDENDLLNVRRQYQSGYEKLLTQVGLSGDFLVKIPLEGDFTTPSTSAHQEALQQARNNRKDLIKLNHAEEILHISLQQFKAGDDSTLTLSADYRRFSDQSQGNKLLDSIDNESWSIMASLNFPFDDHGLTDSNINSIRAQILRLKIEKKQLLDNIENEINDAIRDIQSSIKIDKILNRATLLAEENLKIDELRFNKGVISSDDLQRTQIELLQLRVDDYNTLIDYKLAQAKLHRATGQLQKKYM